MAHITHMLSDVKGFNKNYFHKGHFLLFLSFIYNVLYVGHYFAAHLDFSLS